MNQSKNNNGATAIVMGASLGGLMTARALSTHFDKVIIVESLCNEIAQITDIFVSSAYLAARCARLIA